MARIHTYENDEVVRGGDKWIGSDAQSLNKTKNFTADKVAEYYALNGVMLSPNAVTLKYKEWQNPSGTPSGFFWSFTPVNDLVNVNSVSSFGMSKKDLKVRFFDELLNSFQGHFVFFYNSVNPNNFAVFKLTGIEDHPDNSSLFKIDVQFIDGNGSFTFEDSFFFGLLDRSVSYSDIDGVPTNLSEFTNDVGFITVYDLPNTLLTATQFSSNHTSGLGNGYLAGDVVYYQGRIYKAKFNNDAVLPSVGGNTYWEDLGAGERLRQINADWNSTSGDSLILNKPTIPTKTSDLTNDGYDGLNPFITAVDVPVSTLQEVLNSGNAVSDDTPIVYADNGLTQTRYLNGNVEIVNTGSDYVTNFGSNEIRLQKISDLTKFTAVSFEMPTSDNEILFQDGSGVVAFLSDIPSITSYVPYTGATQDVDLGEHELKAGQIEFDQSPTGTAGTAIMRWNDTDGTVDLGLKGGNVTLQVGQENVVRVVNKTGGNLLESNYQVVRVRLVSEGGAAGQRLAVVLAQANNDTNSATTLGIVTENINNNQEGFITVFGSVREINTTGSLQGETWVDGDILYLSPTTPGQLTNIKPSAPQHLVTVGYVEYAHAIHGKIFVKVDNGYELDELHNVDITSPVNNDVLTYNSSTQVWENKGITTALGYTPENVANKSSSYSVSSTVTYPNTKALVDGLATKGTVIETTTDGTVTSPLVNTVSQVLLIPGGTFGEGMTLETLGWARKTGVNLPFTYRRYVNTTPNLVGSPILIAQPGASASATVYAGLRRFLRIKTSDGSGAGTELTNVSSTSYDDVLGTSTTAVSNVSINWNNDVYIIDTLQCSSASDSARVSSLKVRR